MRTKPCGCVDYDGTGCRCGILRDTSLDCNNRGYHMIGLWVALKGNVCEDIYATIEIDMEGNYLGYGHDIYWFERIFERPLRLEQRCNSCGEFVKIRVNWLAWVPYVFIIFTCWITNRIFIPGKHMRLQK